MRKIAAPRAGGRQHVVEGQQARQSGQRRGGQEPAGECQQADAGQQSDDRQKDAEANQQAMAAIQRQNGSKTRMIKAPAAMGDQSGKQARLGAEGGVITLLHDAPVIHHPNLIVVFGIFQLVRYQQGGLLMRSGIQRLHHPLFAVGVEAGGRFIQQQQAARADQRPGDRHALRWPTDRRAALSPTSVSSPCGR